MEERVEGQGACVILRHAGAQKIEQHMLVYLVSADHWDLSLLMNDTTK